jgi:ferredoxin
MCALFNTLRGLDYASQALRMHNIGATGSLWCKQTVRSTVIQNLLKAHGLILLGIMQVSEQDGVPGISESQPARQLLLIGNGGSSFWPAFSQSAEFRDDMADPLDRWSKRVGEDIASSLGGRAIFPFNGPPYPPFLSWARKTGQVSPSPVSMFIHAKFGLWHAYRFALALPEPQPGLTVKAEVNSPCLNCEGQPCLEACPVNAFSDETYRVDQCMDYLVGDTETACRRLGCEARRACPVKRELTYLPEHARFHMDAFVTTHCP